MFQRNLLMVYLLVIFEHSFVAIAPGTERYC